MCSVHKASHLTGKTRSDRPWQKAQRASDCTTSRHKLQAILNIETSRSLETLYPVEVSVECVNQWSLPRFSCSRRGNHSQAHIVCVSVPFDVQQCHAFHCHKVLDTPMNTNDMKAMVQMVLISQNAKPHPRFKKESDLLQPHWNKAPFRDWKSPRWSQSWYLPSANYQKTCIHDRYYSSPVWPHISIASPIQLQQLSTLLTHLGASASTLPSSGLTVSQGFALRKP